VARIRDRSTTDLLILMIAGTICFSVLAAGATIGVIEIMNPDTDTRAAVGTLSDVINTLIGLLAGFLAGRTQTHLEIQQGERRIGARPARKEEAGDDETA
jgi:hypothetical protein